MSDLKCVMEANFGEPELRVRFGTRRCAKSIFPLPSEVQRFGHALDNVDKLMNFEWFLTAKDENGKRYLVCGVVDGKLDLNIINIDVEKNVDILSSPLFKRRIKRGHGFEVIIKGMDNITPKDRARGGFWIVFSPIE